MYTGKTKKQKLTCQITLIDQNRFFKREILIQIENTGIPGQDKMEIILIVMKKN